MWLCALRSVEYQQVRRMSASASGIVAAMMLSWPSGRRVGGLVENRRTRREQVVLCRVRLGSGGAANQFQALRWITSTEVGNAGNARLKVAGEGGRAKCNHGGYTRITDDEEEEEEEEEKRETDVQEPDAATRVVRVKGSSEHSWRPLNRGL
jgi:hypothetical protein